MQSQFKCFKCGANNYLGQKHCWQCRQPFQNRCPKCGTWNDFIHQTCIKCYTQLPTSNQFHQNMHQPYSQSYHTNDIHQLNKLEHSQASNLSRTRLLILISILFIVAVTLGMVLWYLNNELSNTRTLLTEKKAATQKAADELTQTKQTLAQIQKEIEYIKTGDISKLTGSTPTTELSNSSSNASKSSSHCFIATAAYGSPLAKQLDVLREFRDKVLIPNPFGADFVRYYYEISPPFAGIISNNELLRWYTRYYLIEPIVFIVDVTRFIWLHD